MSRQWEQRKGFKAKPRSSPQYRNAVLVDVPKGLVGRASKTSRGVLLTLADDWTGRLYRMDFFPYTLLSEMGADLQRSSFMSFFKKPAQATSPVGVGAPASMPFCLEKLAPTLGMYLCSDAWPDGEIRQRSSLVVFIEELMFKACLSDKDTQTTLWCSAKTWEGLLEGFEARLTDDVVDWRKARKLKK